ncbi:MAG: sulfotransferase [Lentisphaerales bacterium]|nr:sulfotransferase [Lentisphaerales bacterium]
MLQLLLSQHSKISTSAEPWVALPFLAPITPGLHRSSYNSLWASEAIKEYLLDNKTTEKEIQKVISSALLSVYNLAQKDKPENLFLDKTPRYYMILEKLQELFPEAKFIILKRNPAHVLKSILRTWVKDEYSKLLNYRYDLFMAPQKITQSLSNKNKNLYQTSYEEVVNDPQKTIQGICHFLQIPFEANCISYENEQFQKWKFGDKSGITRHNSPKKNKSSEINDTHNDLINSYISNLGKEVMNKLGYDYENTLVEFPLINPSKSPFDWNNILKENLTITDLLQYSSFQLSLKPQTSNIKKAFDELANFIQDEKQKNPELIEAIEESQLQQASLLSMRVFSTKRNNFLKNTILARELLVKNIKLQTKLLLAEHGGKIKIALYGKGDHSSWLLSNFPEISSRTVIIFDDNCSGVESLKGISVVKPEQHLETKFDIIIPSSDTYQNQITSKIKTLFSKKVTIHLLYDQLPEGPYPK